MDVEALKQFIEKNKFYQSMDLVEGYPIKGNFDSPEELQRLDLPKDMTGMKYLDIGCNAGYYVLSASKRGACATGIDKNRDQIVKGRELLRILGWERVRLLHMSLEDETWKMEPQNIVQMLSVFHHLRTPYEAIRRVREITIDRFVTEIWVAESGERSMNPYGTFFRAPGYYLPTTAGAIAVLKKSGFKRVEVAGPSKTKDRLIFNAYPE